MIFGQAIFFQVGSRDRAAEQILHPAHRAIRQVYSFNVGGFRMTLVSPQETIPAADAAGEQRHSGQFNGVCLKALIHYDLVSGIAYSESLAYS